MRTLILAPVLLALFGAGSDASAQPLKSDTTSAQTGGVDQRAFLPAGKPPESYRSSAEGFAWTLGLSAAPILVAIQMDSPPLLLAGAIVGPSVGNLYAGDMARGYGGIAIRTGATLGFLSTVCILCDDGDSEEALAYTFLAVFVGSAFWNFASIPMSVAAHNRGVRDRLAITPIVDSGTGTPGARISLRF